MPEKTQNINFTGDQNNVQFGEGDNHQTISQGDKPVALKPVFDAAQSILDGDMTSFGEISGDGEDLIAMYGTPSGMVGAMYDQASAEISGAPLPPEKFEADKQTWLARAKAIAPALIRGGLVIGEAVVTKFATGSPVVAGLLAGIEFAKSQMKETA